MCSSLYCVAGESEPSLAISSLPHIILDCCVFLGGTLPTCRTNENDHQSPESFAVEPGDVLTQALLYRAADRSYDMYIHSKNLGKSIKMNYKLLAKQVGSMSSGHMAACWWLTHLLLGPSAL